ncbi:MAG TPA: glycosyltransferase, partial [Pirellulales bacterium]
VFVPCKGLDPGLADNLRPLFEQDYANYRLVFIVESREDPACGVVRSLIDEHPHVAARLLVAGRARTCGQKVHNLLRATERLSPDVQFLAFADSDVRTSATWLRRMIERLVTRADTGAVTGYRWLLPQRHSPAGLVLASLNSAIATLFTSGGHHLLWGGCWAMRRERFESLEIRAAWCGVLSDDVAASRAIHRAGLRIKFEPTCMLASAWDGDCASMFEFLYRQHFMLWRYAPRWSLAMLACMLVGVCGFWAPAAAALLAYCRSGQWSWVLLGPLGLVYGLNVARGRLRAALARRYFPEQRRRLAVAGWFDTFAGPLTAVITLSAMLAAAFGRRVRWRQVSYLVDGAGAVLSVEHGTRRRLASSQQPSLGLPASA